MKLRFYGKTRDLYSLNSLNSLLGATGFQRCVFYMCLFLGGMFAFFVGPNAEASKDKGVYLGAGVNLVNVGVVDPFNNEVNFKAGEFIVGYKYNNYLGLELRGGKSFQKESIRVEDPDTGLRGSVTSDIDSYSSIYYRAELSNEIAKLYLLLGQSKVDTTVEFESAGAEPIELSESGLSYGVGFGLWLDERMNLNFEYRLIVSTDSDSFIAGGINADYRF